MIVGYYTDGSCKSNPGPAGWGYIETNETSGVPVTTYEKYGAYRNEKNELVEGTNQQAEMSACAYALERACTMYNGKVGITVRVYSDSAYLLNCLKEKWYYKWRRNGWRTATGEAVKNQWLWRKITDCVTVLESAGVKIEYIKVKGHSGHALNERADVLANAGTQLSIEFFTTQNGVENSNGLT